MSDLKSRIVANAEILGGKPIVEGTRLSVEHILGLMAHDMSLHEIVEDTKKDFEQIKADTQSAVDLNPQQAASKEKQ